LGKPIKAVYALYVYVYMSRMLPVIGTSLYKLFWVWNN